ncbi:MAG: formate dehydrogenase accessory sulfurtransferase FdhD [Syntrophomonadaceae bacterium]|nr:formate dehydrogenase accessory sulfurtransferase FdhD [Syntrophomonadaceae bacterium]
MGKQVDAVTWYQGQIQETRVHLAMEIPFTVYYNERETVTLLCSPQELDELAIGFLVGEGLLKQPQEIKGLVVDTARGLAWVSAEPDRPLAKEAIGRRFVTSGCGSGTGYYSLADAVLSAKVQTSLVLLPRQVNALLSKMQNLAQQYQVTRGIHGAGLCSPDQVEIFREDIGRHNAVDKILGYCFIKEIKPEDKVLAVTGRISSEIMLKAAKMSIPVLLSRSVPTDMAVIFAEELGITIIGAARAGKFIVYSHRERVALP